MTTFDDPRDFLAHLEQRLAAQDLTPAQQVNLLHGSLHTIRYLVESQRMLTDRMVQTVDVLNAQHITWGHKLSELYTVLEAGQVSPQEMNDILVSEICHAKAK